MRTPRRVARAAVLAAAVMLVSSAMSSSTASPLRSAQPEPASTCDPAVHRAAVTTAMARLGRANDQHRYTLRQLRRIDRRLDKALARHGSSGRRTSGRFGLVLRIPVHAHVIDGAHARGPAKPAVRRQVDILNRAYGGGQSAHNTRTRFQFYLDSFDRTRNQRWYTASLFNAADKQMRRRLHVGGADGLNLYFSAPRSPDAGSVVLGWSTMPWRVSHAPRLDGVTVHQESMPGGDLRRFNRGDTAVHEVGHWLGLFHTFEGGCSLRNDRVADTPAEARPSLACEVGRDTCDADGLDPVHNFMDYSFDSCMNMFTPDQVARMTDNWLAYRTP